MAATLRRPRRTYPAHPSKCSPPKQYHNKSKRYLLTALIALTALALLWIWTPSTLFRRKALPKPNTSVLFKIEALSKQTFSSNDSDISSGLGDGSDYNPLLGEVTIAAILPLSGGTVENIHAILAPLFIEESSLTTVILLIPTQLVPLINIVLNGIKSSFVDIDIQSWSSRMNEHEAVLDAAWRVEADYVLVLDKLALSGLDIETQDRLLVHPLMTDLPDGPCGGMDMNGSVTCVIPSIEPQRAAFVLPPFLAPTSLLRNYSTQRSEKSFNGWQAFGEWTASRYDGVGGITRGHDDASHSSCIARCRANNIAVSEVLLQAQASHDIPVPVQTEDNVPNIIIILPTLHDLESFSPATCRLSKIGVDMHILLLSNANGAGGDHTGAFPWIHDQLIQRGCRLSFSSLHSSSNDYANAEAATYWLSLVVTNDSVVIYGDAGNEFSLFEAEVEKTRTQGVTLITLPIQDLQHAEWIASLDAYELKGWHKPKIEISIVTDDRPHSLLRLLKSLQNAVYFGDTVNVRINLEQTAGQETLKVVNDFDWKFGALVIHHRVVHGGLLPAVTESWYPHSNDSYGIILEDDTEVSPLFYAWAKMALLRYRYGRKTNKSPSLFGISLYQQKNLELRLEGTLPFNARALFDSHGFEYRNTPFLSQIPCSWGAVYFPEHWREFHSYLILRFSEQLFPLQEMVVPHVRSNRWTRSWKKYFIELAYLQGHVMLYPNYDDYLSLSTNHLELGSHVKQLPKELFERKKAQFTLPLLQVYDSSSSDSEGKRVGLLDLPEERLPPWTELPILDLVGMVSTSSDLIKRGTQRQQQLTNCTTTANDRTRRRGFDVQGLFDCNIQHVNEDSN